MSGSSSLPTADLTDAERVDVRRFCGYPAFGNTASGGQSWRFFQAYGTLEFRLSNVTAEELQVIRQYLAWLYLLEQAVPTAAANLDTDNAASWTHSRTEVMDRVRLFDEWRRRLAVFLGIPLDPDSAFGGRIVI